MQFFKIGDDSSDDTNEKVLYCIVNLTNIGRSFANTLIINDGINSVENEFHRLIQVDNSEKLCFAINSQYLKTTNIIEFSVTYIDCMTNEYMQSYTIKLNSTKTNDISIENGYPVFLYKTHAIC